jgi:multidrug resistance efflux pump
MRSFMWLGCGVLALVVAARGGSPATKSASGLGLWPNSGEAASDGSIEVAGVTQCVPGRRASIAPVPLHPVVDVKVVPGDYVKKGQLLVKLDDDEARADVRAKQAQLESAQYSAAEARRFLTKARAKQAVLPEQRLHEAELAVRKSEADERAARAALDSSEAELEHFSVSAVIDGVVSWLEVYPGLVSRPGTSLWGEIVDIRELDVRCEATHV